MSITKTEAIKTTNIVFEEFSEYLEVLEKGRTLVLSEQAKEFGFDIKTGEVPVAYRRVRKGGHYLPLYDRTNEMKFISNENLIAVYGFSGDVVAFGVDPDVLDVEGYAIQFGKFYKVYDVSKLIKKYNLKKIHSPRFPIVRGDKIGRFELLKKHQDKMVGYKELEQKLVPVFDLIEIAASERKLLFQSGEPKFPFVDRWFFERFKEKITYTEEDCVGFTYHPNASQLEEIYDVRLALARGPKIYNVIQANKRDAIVSVESYEEFEKKISSSYYQYVHFLGMTGNDEMVLRGPGTEKWMNIREQFTYVKPLKQEGKVLAKGYGIYGIEPCHQCFGRSCQSSSSDSLCGGFGRYEELGNGLYEVECDYRLYEEDASDTIFPKHKGKSRLDEMATDKQLSYLDYLLEKGGFKFKDGQRDIITKGQAGAVIGQFNEKREIQGELLEFVQRLDE